MIGERGRILGRFRRNGDSGGREGRARIKSSRKFEKDLWKITVSVGFSGGTKTDLYTRVVYRLSSFNNG